MDVTASTKCWEGDYRTVLTSEGIDRLLNRLGPVARRQVVLNRIQDREGARRLADGLVASGAIDEWVWAEELWPGVAQRLDIPRRWFGPAWPYSVPELCELSLARTPLLVHQAGDVGFRGEPGWLVRAIPMLDRRDVSVVAAGSPSGEELRSESSRAMGDGWMASRSFSDQFFLVRPAELLRREVVTACHPDVSRFPKIGGALTFEARVDAWLHSTARWRCVDERNAYDHPVGGGIEGASYLELAAEELPPLPTASAGYPLPRSVAATGLILVRNGERFIGAAVTSLGWCQRVLVIDQQSEDRTAEQARLAGAEVVQGRVTPEVDPAKRDAVAELAPGWVVLLDADEVCPPGLAGRIADVVSSGRADGVLMARQNFVAGRWTRFGRGWPDWQLRAFRAERVSMPGGVHNPITLLDGARLERLAPTPPLAIVHFNYAGLHDWLDRTNRYTTSQSAALVLDRNVSGRAAVRGFARSFFGGAGWRAGRMGLRSAFLDALYQWVLVEKWAEQIRGGPTSVLAGYDEIAESVVSGRTEEARQRRGA